MRIAVADTGRGITEQDIARLFAPFERLDAAQAGIEGTGLGLALSRQLVEAMDGSTGVTSTPGVGSVFWIELAITEPAAVSQKAIARDTVAASRPYTSAKTVLYVEDMVENVRLVEQILKHRPSVTLIPAMLAGVALDLARQHHPDLVPLDLHLPDMPGEEVLRRLRADPATEASPWSSSAPTPPSITSLSSWPPGADAYLTKPISVRALLQTIDQTLGQQPSLPGPAPAWATAPPKDQTGASTHDAGGDPSRRAPRVIASPLPRSPVRPVGISGVWPLRGARFRFPVEGQRCGAAGRPRRPAT